MVEVIFENSNGEERSIALCDSEKNAIAEIRRFCEAAHFRIWYMRAWQVDDRMKYDVGSHTEFFYTKEVE